VYNQRSGRSGIRIPTGTTQKSLVTVQIVQAGYGCQPGSYSVGTGVLSRGLTLATHFHPETRIRMSGPLPLLPLFALLAWAKTTLPLIYCYPNIHTEHTVRLIPNS
jgi:hypothetical protein